MADGCRIRELRTRHGLLQREFVEMAGVTESAVRKWELGLRAPCPQHLEALSRTLGVDPAPSSTTGSRRCETRGSGEIPEGGAPRLEARVRRRMDFYG